jgi:hypothetical protein
VQHAGGTGCNEPVVDGKLRTVNSFLNSVTATLSSGKRVSNAAFNIANSALVFTPSRSIHIGHIASKPFLSFCRA